jgi:hypothetical protein
MKSIDEKIIALGKKPKRAGFTKHHNQKESKVRKLMAKKSRKENNK